MLTHAQDLYDFANEYRGNFAHSFPEILGYSGYGDELGWAAAWLLRATDDQTYRAHVDQHIAEFNLTESSTTFSLDDKKTAFQALMAKITNEESFRQLLQNYCNYVVQYGPRTPKGLYFIDARGSLRYASNTAFICLQVSLYREAHDCIRNVCLGRRFGYRSTISHGFLDECYTAYSLAYRKKSSSTKPSSIESSHQSSSTILLSIL